VFQRLFIVMYLLGKAVLDEFNSSIERLSLVASRAVVVHLIYIGVLSYFAVFGKRVTAARAYRLLRVHLSFLHGMLGQILRRPK
jgi:hypothetical protein